MQSNQPKRKETKPMTTKAERQARYFSTMDRLGVSYQDAAALRRCEMTLRRWYELECGNSDNRASWFIERNEYNGKPYFVTLPNEGKRQNRRIPDRETGAKKRAAAIATRYGLTIRHQDDPRGGALYLVTKDGQEIYCNY
jgi:hypothetical protein